MYSDINRIRKKLYKKEVIHAFLKDKERNDNLTDSEKKPLKKTDKYLNNFERELDRLQKNQYSITYGLDKIDNEQDNLDYYMSKEVKSAFDGSYVLYESNGDKDAKLSIDEYFNIVRPLLKDMIDDHKSKDEWKIQLSMRIIFVSFTDANETRETHTKSDNITIMRGVENEDIINELFNTFRKRYQEGLETKMKGSSFTFERIDLLEYHLHKISLNRGSSYIDSPIWIKNKGVTINPQNTKDNNCFQYAITAALNYQNIDHHPKRISKLKPFINNCNWKDIEFPSHSKNWRKFECNNNTIALNILYVPNKKVKIKEASKSERGNKNDNKNGNKNDNKNDNKYDSTKQIRPAYILKHDNERDTQVNLLMITDRTDNWHYIAVKGIPGLLRGITSNHNGDFYCLNCFLAYTTKNKLRKHERIRDDHDFCYVNMPDDDNNILESLIRKFVIHVEKIFILMKIIKKNLS